VVCIGALFTPVSIERGPADALADAATASAPATPSAIMRFFIIVCSMALRPREAANWCDNAAE
jgi:hypothetical protein